METSCPESLVDRSGSAGESAVIFCLECAVIPCGRLEPRGIRGTFQITVPFSFPSELNARNITYQTLFPNHCIFKYKRIRTGRYSCGRCGQRQRRGGSPSSSPITARCARGIATARAGRRRSAPRSTKGAGTVGTTQGSRDHREPGSASASKPVCMAPAWRLGPVIMAHGSGHGPARLWQDRTPTFPKEGLDHARAAMGHVGFPGSSAQQKKKTWCPYRVQQGVGKIKQPKDPVKESPVSGRNEVRLWDCLWSGGAGPMAPCWTTFSGAAPGCPCRVPLLLVPPARRIRSLGRQTCPRRDLHLASRRLGETNADADVDRTVESKETDADRAREAFSLGRGGPGCARTGQEGREASSPL
eukprot:gene7635-biopygen6068